MHFGNISFLSEGYLHFDPAPSYDMLPMLYSPVQGELPDREFLPSQPKPGHAEQWLAAVSVAHDFWIRLGRDDRASAEFGTIAKVNAERVGGLR